MTTRRIALLMPNLQGGGAERVVVNIANEFVMRDCAVDLVLMSAEGEFLSELHPEVQVINLHANRIRGVLLPLVRYLRRARPTALLANMWPLTVVALLGRRLSGVKTRVIVAEHTTWSRSELLERWSVGWQVRNSMRCFFRGADGIVTVSNGAADDLARFARLERKSITVIYNPVVGAEQTPPGALSEPAGWCNGTHRKVLAVGTLKAIKDFDLLLAAFDRLRHRVDARLLILGEGECRAPLEAAVRRMGLEASVFMPGFVKNLSPYYALADLHVLSSKGEGFGNVIVEALAAGTPVVSTDCLSGPREILADGKYGRLVPVGDADALARAMEASLTTAHDSKALIARAQDFSIDKAVDQYEKLLLGR